tara:strand:+ start:5 stop:793 length:789 start_codon:yes stop_codon:yes gene_type:complete
MPEIEPIKIYNLNINNLNIPKARVFDIPPPVINNLFLPVTVDIGNPIIEMPGCVKDHPDGNEQLAEDDPKGTKILCSNEYPSYDAIDYTPEDLVYPQEESVPPVKTPESEPETPSTPKVSSPSIPQTKKEETECPGPNQPRIGDVAQNQKERVSGYELQMVNGQEICVVLYEDIPWQAQYLPAPQVAATTATIAVVATSSALLAKPLADLLLKVFKPAIKKIMTKISKLRGKKVPILSSRDRQDLQRERSQAIRNLRKMTKG